VADARRTSTPATRSPRLARLKVAAPLVLAGEGDKGFKHPGHSGGDAHPCRCLPTPYRAWNCS
jgi:hypothetical protein